jgi:hypothetical protein
MRMRTFLNRLALGALLCVLLQASTCYYGYLDYDVPRPGGGTDHVQLEAVYELSVFAGRDEAPTATTFNLTVNGRPLEPSSAEYRRYLDLLYIPTITAKTETGVTRTFQNYDDPSTGTRPRGSPNPPIPDPTLGTRPKS